MKSLRKSQHRNLLRRCAGIILGTLISGAVFPGVAAAQEKYPGKPINLIVGYPAGGTTDLGARALASAAGKILGQPVIILNKPGGASSVAMAYLKNEKPDGYTIGVLASGGVISQHLRKVPYDSARDFTPIMQYAVYLYAMVVRADSPWKTFRDFIDDAKANPGKIRYSTGGSGTPQHLVMERLAAKEKIKWTHIPFQGNGPAVAALLGGHVEANPGTSEWKPHVQAGRLKLLAAFGEKRMAEFPDVPTLLELGYDIVAPSLICIVGPKGIPFPIVQTLHDAFKKAMADPDFINVNKVGDMPLIYRGPEDLGKHLIQMNGDLESLVKSLGLREG